MSFTSSSASVRSIHPGVPPQPDESKDSYTSERLREGLLYANKAIVYFREDRNLSGISHFILNHYRGLCEAALAIDPGATKQMNELTKEIRYYEREMRFRPSLVMAVSEELAPTNKECLALVRMQILARYGDHVSDFWAFIKQAITHHSNDIKFPKTVTNALVTTLYDELQIEKPKWEKIHASLEAENAVWNEHKASLGVEPVKHSYTLWQISKAQNIPFDYLKSMVAMYADRNRQFHGSLSHLLREGNPYQIARLLHSDYTWVCQNYPADKPAEKRMLVFWFEMRITEWFDALAGTDPPEKWFASASLQKAIKMARPKPPAERKAAADRSAAIAKKRENEDAAKAAVKACDDLLRAENRATAMNVVDYIASNAEVNEHLFACLFGGRSDLIEKPIDDKFRAAIELRYQKLQKPKKGKGVMNRSPKDRKAAWDDLVQKCDLALNSSGTLVPQIQKALAHSTNVLWEAEMFRTQWESSGPETPSQPTSPLASEFDKLGISSGTDKGKGKEKEVSTVSPVSHEGQKPEGSQPRARSPVKRIKDTLKRMSSSDKLRRT